MAELADLDALPAQLDDFQVWLLEQRTADDPNIIFAIFDGFRAFADWLVTAFDDTVPVAHLVGTFAAARADRAALRRLPAALIVLAAFARSR